MALLIDKDQYFSKTQEAKSEELANVVKVKFSPLAPLDADVVFKSKDPTAIADGASVVVPVVFTKTPVVPEAIGGVAAPSVVAYLTDDEGERVQVNSVDVTLTATGTYTAIGATVTVTNSRQSDGYFVIEITGVQLDVQGEGVVEARDDESILEHGVLTYEMKDNRLIQSELLADIVASGLLSSYKQSRRDASIDWRGYPPLELGDVVILPDYVKGPVSRYSSFMVVRQNTTFDGTLRATTDCRITDDGGMGDTYFFTTDTMIFDGDSFTFITTTGI